MIRIATSLLLIFLLSTVAHSQASDSLTLSDYSAIVLSNYPLMKRAQLYDEISQAYVLKGRGILDPKFVTSYDRKEFKGSNYFNRWFSEVKIPTRYPIDLAVGYENNDGAFLNEESRVPGNGLIYGTLNISLLRGLMFDEQRYHLQAAELQGVKSTLEKEILLREIVTQSIIAYIDWAASYYNFVGYQDYEQTIAMRHQNIVSLYENGDKPAIDTIESRVNWNTAIKQRLNAYNEYLFKTQKINLFLWDDKGNPLTISEDIVPQRTESIIDILDSYSAIINPNWNQDLIIKKKENEVQAIDLKNKLVREMFKPQLDLKLNTIYNLGDDDLSLSYNVNDYKVGVSIEIPLMNRKNKGQLQLNKAIQEQTKLDQKYYESKLGNEYEMLVNSRRINEEIIVNANEKIKFSQTLYEAEVLKFQIGESSVFLLNQRERKLLESKIEAVKSYKNMCLILNQFYYLKLGQS